MKIYGLFWGFFNCGTLVLGIWFSNLMAKHDEFWTNPVYGYVICIIVFFIFFNLIVLKGDKLILIRPLWFLYKRKSFMMSEINQVEFLKIYHATTSSTEMKFLDKEGLIILKTTIYWFKFEEKRLINKLMELGIETTTNFD